VRVGVVRIDAQGLGVLGYGLVVFPQVPQTITGVIVGNIVPSGYFQRVCPKGRAVLPIVDLALRGERARQNRAKRRCTENNASMCPAGDELRPPQATMTNNPMSGT